MSITHTILRTVSFNGQVEFPSAVEPGESSGKQGVNLEADNGGLTVVVTGTKRRWVCSWDKPLPGVVARVRALYALTSAITFIDPDGASYSVSIPIGGMRLRANHGDAGSTLATTYTLELEVWEQ